VGFAIWGSEEQQPEDHHGKTSSGISGTLTFLAFFYSMTLLTSYFYPLDWAPVAF
jgi:hypothetical protein